jgi:hypothetical protein
MILAILLLAISLTANGILVWYCRKLIKNLWYGINNADELQKLLLEYAASLESLYNIQNYSDETIEIAIGNTKLIAEACRVYKDSIIEKQDDKNSEKNTTDTSA